MSRLPDTTTPKPTRRTPGLTLVLASAALLGAVLFAALFPGEDDLTPGEEVHSPGIEDIAVGTGDASFPRRDASRFEGGTEVVRVYLRVEDLPPGRRLTAEVERSGRASAVSRLFGERVRTDGGGEDRLSVSEGGVSGVVAFEVRADGALPAGEYTVEVRSKGRNGDGGDAVLARKYFLVGDRQA